MIETFLQLGMAIFIGGLIGAEREYCNKSAGFRTFIFISFGSALFTILGLKFASDYDPLRVVGAIISGVGFLGAGVMFKDGRQTGGLTTAAVIWLTASLGIAVGMKEYAIATFGGIVSVIILWYFPRFEEFLDRKSDTRYYLVEWEGKYNEKIQDIEQMFNKHELSVAKMKESKQGIILSCELKVHGPPDKHDKVTEELFKLDDIREITSSYMQH